MGSRERIARLKDKLRIDILNTAMAMLKNEGRHSLSLRKIADEIEYSAPVIYSHFKNKEAILIALSNLGYQQLNLNIQRNCNHMVDSKQKLAALLTTCWDFAVEEKELYQLMYEVGVGLENPYHNFPELTKFISYLKQTISAIHSEKKLSDKLLLGESYASIAVVHGLISANLFWKDIDRKSNKIMLDEVISSIVNSLLPTKASDSNQKQ